ncbi:hypothetical protein [Thermaerobacillus caldiproteolyticus]|nr:hypothetical protein [Anoxybacillus caldiproteolyticus]
MRSNWRKRGVMINGISINRALEDQIISEGVAEGIIIGCNFWNLLQVL